MVNISNDFNYLDQYDDFYKLSTKIQSLLYSQPFVEVTDLYGRKYSRKKVLSANEIANLLGEKYNDVYKVLQVLLVNKGFIIKDDYWDKESKYEIVDKYRQDSSFTKQYYELSAIDKIESFLLISDTHIGNKSLEDLRLIHNIYDFALKNGIKICFHMGDLFEGSEEIDPKITEEQLNKFINDYPNLNEIKTYSLIGNHDEFVNSYLKSIRYPKYSDLRCLSLYNPSFYMFPRRRFKTKISNRFVNFSHRYFLSFMVDSCEINCLEDLEDEENDIFLDCEYDILISGHLHHGFIYTKKYDRDERFGKEHIYIGVPSTSKLNIDNSVGCIIRPFYDGNNLTHIELDVLGADNNRNIFIRETINYSFIHNDKVYNRKI